jgi:hypothetical protein
MRAVIVGAAIALVVAVSSVFVPWQIADASRNCQECRVRFCCSSSSVGWTTCIHGNMDPDRQECIWCEVGGDPCPILVRQ